MVFTDKASSSFWQNCRARCWEEWYRTHGILNEDQSQKSFAEYFLGWPKNTLSRIFYLLCNIVLLGTPIVFKILMQSVLEYSLKVIDTVLFIWHEQNEKNNSPLQAISGLIWLFIGLPCNLITAFVIRPITSPAASLKEFGQAFGWGGKIFSVMMSVLGYSALLTFLLPIAIPSNISLGIFNIPVIGPAYFWGLEQIASFAQWAQALTIAKVFEVIAITTGIGLTSHAVCHVFPRWISNSSSTEQDDSYKTPPTSPRDRSNASLYAIDDELQKTPKSDRVIDRKVFNEDKITPLQFFSFDCSNPENGNKKTSQKKHRRTSSRLSEISDHSDSENVIPETVGSVPPGSEDTEDVDFLGAFWLNNSASDNEPSNIPTISTAKIPIENEL